MGKDKLYIDNNNRAITVELPEYGEIRLIIQGGKVVRTETLSSQKVQDKQCLESLGSVKNYITKTNKWEKREIQKNLTKPDI